MSTNQTTTHESKSINDSLPKDAMNAKIIDCFLFNNEKHLLIARIQYLEKYVDHFCIVESEYSFTGQKKQFFAKQIIEQEFGNDFLENRVCILENTEYISADNVDEITSKYSAKLLASELKHQYNSVKHDKFVWLNDCFQRELLSEILLQCIMQNTLNVDSVEVLLSDVDEIPCINFVTHIKNSGDAIIFAEMDQFRYNMNIMDKEKWIGTVKFNFEHLSQYTVNELRFATKREQSAVEKYKIQPNSGWHFTSFGSLSEIKNKMSSWGHQELNTTINRLFLPFRLTYGLDIFGRDISYDLLVENVIPTELKAHLSQLSSIPTKKPLLAHKLLHRILWFLDRVVYRLTR